MWTFIVSAVASIGGAIAKLASAALRWAAVILAYRVGKRKAEQESLERAAEVKDEQLKHAARRPRSKSDIIKRMRDNDL